MSLFDLSGKVALVTGGARGIGYGIAEGLARAGAKTVLVGRDAKQGEASARTLSGYAESVFLAYDLRDLEALRGLPDVAAARLGGVDILVNNAGINIARPPLETTLEDWRVILDVNLTAAFVLAQATHPHLKARGGGKIINVGSMATRLGSARAVPYAASKGGLGQLTLSLAAAWGGDNIQVNAILPGYIDTDLVQNARAQDPQFEERVIARTPLKRFGRPADCAGAAVFLASSASDFVTGALIPVDGGFTCHI